MSNLFQQFAAGSEGAFNTYYKRYHRSVYGSLKKLCGDPLLAEDLTQEVFRNLWDRRASFNDEEHLRNNLFLMARTGFLMHVRKRKKVAEAEGEAGRTATVVEPVDFVFITEEVHAVVEGTMMKLPTQQKLVLELLLNGLDVKAVAKKLRLAPQTVRNHKSQAIHFMRSELYGRDLSFITLLIVLLSCFY